MVADGSSVAKVIARASGALAALLGLLALAGWVADVRILATFGSRWIPMAPSTALFFVVLGILLATTPRPKGERHPPRAVRIVVGAIVLAGTALLVLSLLGIDADLEHLGMEITGSVNGAPFGHMSPLTAAAFVMSGLSFLLLFAASPVPRGRRRAARTLAATVVATAAALSLAYLLGGPFLFRGAVISPALTTSLGFLALGGSLLSRTWRAPAADPTLEPDDAAWKRGIMWAALALTVLIVGTSYAYFRDYTTEFRTDVATRLATVAELKVERLVQWRRERLGDAAVFHGNRHFARLVEDALGEPTRREPALEWLAHVRTAYRYDRISLLDADGVERFAVPASSSSESHHSSSDAIRALRSGEVVVRDFHRDAPGETVHLTVLVPIVDAADRGLGVLTIRADPHTQLYPMLRTWPVPRRTAETVLVRREGDEVVVLNGLSSLGNDPLSPRIPLSRNRVPAVRAALGEEGVVEGVDFDGREVVAALARVPDSPWFLVTRLDTAEAYGPMQERLWWTIGLVAVLLLGLMGMAGLFWQRRRRLHYESLARAEESTRRKQEMLQRTERIAHVGSWEWDVATDTVTWSDELYRIFGLDPSADAPTFAEHADLYPPEDFERLREAVDETLEHGTPYELELRTRRPDGEIRYGLTRGRAKTGPDGEVVRLYGSVQDVTERKRAEEERERLRARLSRAQRMEAVGQLAGGVAHDFNNMLSVILGRIELALRELDPSDPLHAGLREAREAGRRSAELIRQLLGYASRQPVAPEVIDLNETIREMLTMLEPLIGEDVRLTLDLAEDLWLVEIDPSQVDQVLTNLLINARDAIEDVGEVVLETGNVVVDRETAEGSRDMAQGEYAMLAVSDDGVGMEPEVLEKIFDPFFTTKPMGEGTGLGLSTAYGIVRQNGGFFHVYSEVDRGTTFEIYLPRVEGDRRRSSSVASEATTRGGEETVLVVEDEEAVLGLIVRMLEGLGYTVLATSAPAEALRLARRHGDEVDVLLTDVVMPGMNGRDLAERLREERPELAVVYMSGYTADVLADEDLDGERAEFVQKPVTIHDLATAIRDALGDRGA